MHKIYHLISGGDAGGAKTHIYSLMKGLAGKVDAKILCFIRDRFYEDAIKNNIPIEVVEQRSRFDMSVMKKISRKATRESVEILHCHGARANFNALFFKGNIPKVTTIHSDYLLDFKDNKLKDMIFTPLNKMALKKFPFYISVTKNFKNMLIDRGFPEDRIFVIYNGIDIHREEEFVSKEVFLSRYQIPNDHSYLFGIAARLDKVKDHQTLLKAIGKEKNILTNTRFLIAGTGAEEEHLKQMAKELGIDDRVHFLGQVDDPFSLFNAIDINMLTSKSESFPYALLEGAKLSKPVIATSVGGIPEMVRDGKDGWLFQPGNIEELATILREVKDHPDQGRVRGESFNQRVKEFFTVEAMANRHIDIYKEILRQSGRKE
ncbi:MAG: glycosyltransferase [Tissierellia bacterium]|nr:glycosyltransferase [Tissierellia bacterium]